MTKKTLFLISAVFMGISLLFNIIYDILYSVFTLSNYGGGLTLSLIIPWIFTAFSIIVLIVGLILQNKILISVYFGYKTISSFFSMISTIISCINGFNLEYFLPVVFSNAASVALNIGMLIFVLAMFGLNINKTSDKLKTNNPANQQNYFPQQNYGNQQNFAGQQNYGNQQNFAGQQNYGTQLNNFASQQNFTQQ